MKSLACMNFIRRANEKHNNSYDYSIIDFKDIYTPVNIVCRKHGVFSVTPRSHLNGCGCKLCSFKKFSQFYKKALDKFGSKYKYEPVSDFNLKPNTKIKISCPVHGDFYQTIYNHIRGNGCPKCSYEEESSKISMGYYEFVKRSNILHQNKYNYDLVEYKNNRTKVIIKCPMHGNFLQTPHDHLYGCGCPKCNSKHN